VRVIGVSILALLLTVLVGAGPLTVREGPHNLAALALIIQTGLPLVDAG